MFLLFDSNRAINWRVFLETRFLAGCLDAAGAQVFVARLPSRPDGRHWGPDDYLVARGVDSLARILEEARPLAEAYSDLDEVIDDLNQRFAVVALGSSVRILRESFDPELLRPRLDFFTQADFELLLKHRRVKEGERESAAGAAWLRNPRRRTYERVVLVPELKDPDAYNLWKGFSVEPAPGDWSRLRSHLQENVCQGNEVHFQYLLDWLADGVQHLSRRPGVGLVLRGGEGTGKSTLARHYGALFGPHCRVVSQARHLVGHFNGHLADCLLLVAEEAFWAGDKQAGGVLKDLLTGDTLNLERKGKDAILIPNRLRAIFLSNEAWVIPAGLDARRFFVLDVGEAHKQDRAYFAAIEAQMKAGGYEAMLHELLTRDLSQADLGRIPQTPALLEQKILSFGPIERFWYGCLQRGEVVPGRRWEEPTPTEEVHEAYLQEATKLGDRRKSSETELGMALKRLLCSKHTRKKVTVVVRKPDPDIKGRYLTETARPWCYQLPTLAESRAMFEQLTQAPN